MIKTTKIFFRGIISAVSALLLMPFFASAHEVYVLDHASTAADLSKPPLDLFAVAVSHEHVLLVSLFIGTLGIVCIFGISLSRKIESWIDPIIFKIKPYAAHIAQLTLGLALLASAYYHALFGTELPLQMLFGAYAPAAVIGLYCASVLLILGIYPRVGGLFAVVIYIAAVTKEGHYMVSYLTYFGEALVTLLFGGGYTFFSLKYPLGSGKLISAIQKRKHLILRIAFSASLIYAAFYAKLIHGALALDTVNQYHLTNYFPFDPLFIVLGAFLVEMTIGIFYLVGFEIRFTSIFFLTFLFMSLVFFGEAVWPHIVLIGTALAMFVHGYDEYTVERLWYTKDKREPVL